MNVLISLLLFIGVTFAKSKTLTFDFNQGAQGWTAAFADYPPGQEGFFELQSGIRPLPPEISSTKKGFFISGNNHSDDLYMYLKRKLNLEPGVSYEITYTITFASNAPSNCFGTGGAPGEAVGLKAGAINVPPKTFVDSQNFIRTLFDHQPTISDIANGIPCDDSHGEYKTLVRHGRSLTRRTGKDGVLWLIVGTDSGFESTTSLYYEKIEVTLRR